MRCGGSYFACSRRLRRSREGVGSGGMSDGLCLTRGMEGVAPRIVDLPFPLNLSEARPTEPAGHEGVQRLPGCVSPRILDRKPLTDTRFSSVPRVGCGYRGQLHCISSKRRSWLSGYVLHWPSGPHRPHARLGPPRSSGRSTPLAGTCRFLSTMQRIATAVRAAARKSLFPARNPGVCRSAPRPPSKFCRLPALLRGYPALFRGCR